MHVRFYFTTFVIPFPSWGGPQEELETESKVFHCSMKLPFSPGAVLGRMWNHHGNLESCLMEWCQASFWVLTFCSELDIVVPGVQS